MTRLAAFLGPIDGWLIETAWQASLLVGLVWFLDRLLGRRLAPRWRYLLWMLVALRLMLPVLPPAPTSSARLLPVGLNRSAVAPR